MYPRPWWCKSIEGGSGQIREEIFDDDCLYDNPDLEDMLKLYKKKRVGNKLRDFLKWYRSMYTSRHIYDHLRKQGFSQYDVMLQLSGTYISTRGKCTRERRLAAPHIIFIHKDHSCVRLKPLVGGTVESYTPFPTVSFSIVYDVQRTSFDNEAFKVSRDGRPIPKAGINVSSACLNPDLSYRRIDQLMQSTHLRVPKPSISDTKFFENLKLQE